MRRVVYISGPDKHTLRWCPAYCMHLDRPHAAPMPVAHTHSCMQTCTMQH